MLSLGIVEKNQSYQVCVSFNPTSREQWRWHFAGQAMQAIMSCSENYLDDSGETVRSRQSITCEATKYADALLSELEKKDS